MTYVFGGTLNLVQSINQSINPLFMPRAHLRIFNSRYKNELIITVTVIIVIII